MCFLPSWEDQWQHFLWPNPVLSPFIRWKAQLVEVVVLDKVHKARLWGVVVDKVEVTVLGPRSQSKHCLLVISQEKPVSLSSSRHQTYRRNALLQSEIRWHHLHQRIANAHEHVFRGHSKFLPPKVNFLWDGRHLTRLAVHCLECLAEGL